MTTPSTAEIDEVTGLRHQLADQLLAAGHIRTTPVDNALRTVPRHTFAPEVPVEAAYANNIVPTRHAPDGRNISSISAPWLRADMLESAHPQPGHRVLEILESRQVRSPSDLPRTCIPAGRCPEACPRSMM